MRCWRAVLMAMLVAGAFPAVAQAAVKVTFVAPERYRDSDLRRASSRAAILGELRQHFQVLGERFLRRDQVLTIEVLDVHLAGHYEPWRPTFGQVRIMRDVTPPRIRLRYTLRQNGRVVRSGSETVSDMAYLTQPSARLSSGRLVYEKDLLTDWFHRRFGTR